MKTLGKIMLYLGIAVFLSAVALIFKEPWRDPVDIYNSSERED